ncbi:hypothetical protein ACROYT_G017487 [Oculina patagonica]
MPEAKEHYKQLGIDLTMQIICREDKEVSRSSGKTEGLITYPNWSSCSASAGLPVGKKRLQISLVKLTVEETTSLESMYVKCGVFLLMLMCGIGYCSGMDVGAMIRTRVIVQTTKVCATWTIIQNGCIVIVQPLAEFVTRILAGVKIYTLTVQGWRNAEIAARAIKPSLALSFIVLKRVASVSDSALLFKES